MAMISLRLPESIHEAARELARKERISINQLVTLALAEKLAALLTEDLLEARAARGDRTAFEAALAKAPDVEPEAYDRLPAPYQVLMETEGAYRARGPVTFDEVWRRIGEHEGEVFHQMRGREFTYTVRGNYVRPSTVNQAISRSDFEEAFRLTPLEDTTVVRHLRGPSYLYAILMDTRIRGRDW